LSQFGASGFASFFFHSTFLFFRVVVFQTLRLSSPLFCLGALCFEWFLVFFHKAFLTGFRGIVPFFLLFSLLVCYLPFMTKPFHFHVSLPFRRPENGFGLHYLNPPQPPTTVLTTNFSLNAPMLF